jgi:hypothetical protein
MIIIVLLTLVLALVFFSTIRIETIILRDWEFILLAVLIVIGFWLYSVRLPRAVSGKIGFAIAIIPETKELEERITADFVTKLRALLQNSNFRYHFCFVYIPLHIAREIQSLEDAIKVLHDSRCHFMLYGRARSRNVQGKQLQIIDLDGVVSHNPIPAQVQKLFSAEFSELFPKKLMIPREGDVFAFEITAVLVDIISEYIIGVAALVSGDFPYSQDLFQQVEHDSKTIETDYPAIVKIRQRIPERLAQVYLVQATASYINWRRARAPGLMTEMKTHLDDLARVNPENPEGCTLRSIWYFVVNRDVEAAIGEIEKCRTRENPVWRYNYAFLLAYKGSMKKALTEYKRAAKALLPEPRTL